MCKTKQFYGMDEVDVNVKESQQDMFTLFDAILLDRI